MAKILVPLTDLDLTMIRLESGGAVKTPGVLRFEAALNHCFSINPDINPKKIAGMIDTQILVETAVLYGINRAKAIETLPKMLAWMEQWYIEHAGKIYIMPGVQGFLDYVQNRAIIALLTGNVKGIAQHKLRAVELDHYIQVWACSNPTILERRILVPRAVEQAQLLAPNAKLVPFIVGDSKRDAEAAKDNNIPSLIVPASHPYDERELIMAGATLVVPSLERLDLIRPFLDKLLEE